MILITGSITDYITPSGIVYADYDNDMFYPKYPFQNKHNGYMYINILFADGKIKNRRLHVLLAKAFIFNPKPKILNRVGHLDNDKTNYSLSNLYWTTNKDNTQKAVDDGLNINKKAEEDNQSTPIKALDKNTLEVVGVYGSLSECNRCIDNITLSTIGKVYKNKEYKPRIKRFIYRMISKEEFNTYPEELVSKHLVENNQNNKHPKVFRMTNNKLKYSAIFDNQIEASKICGISQALISKYIRNRDTTCHNGWSFEYLGETTRKESSAYENHLATVDSITIQNINDGRILEFKSGKELKDYFGLQGHDIMHYIKANQILMSEWKVIDKSAKVNEELLYTG